MTPTLRYLKSHDHMYSLLDILQGLSEKENPTKIRVKVVGELNTRKVPALV